MKQYTARKIVDIFIEANSEEEAMEKVNDMTIILKDDVSHYYDFEVLKVDIEEVIG